MSYDAQFWEAMSNGEGYFGVDVIWEDSNVYFAETFSFPHFKYKKLNKIQNTTLIDAINFYRTGSTNNFIKNKTPSNINWKTTQITNANINGIYLNNKQFFDLIMNHTTCQDFKNLINQFYQISSNIIRKNP